MNVQRIDRQLANLIWPPLMPTDAPDFRPGDVLIICGGFEDRVMAVLKAAQLAGAVGLRVVDFEYRPSIQQNHFPEIASLCAQMGWEHINLVYDRCDPAGAFETVAAFLPRDGNRLYIDVSGMSRLLIVQLIAGLMENRPVTPAVSVLYTEAQSYPPSEAEARQELTERSLDSETLLSFISTGVYEVAVVPELSSSNLHRAPIRLIAFPSFNPTQFVRIRSSIQPAHITLIHGVPPDPALKWRTEIIRNLNQINEAKDSDAATVSTLDYSETLRVLLQLYERWAEFNSLVISPTGSKMQAVAVGIFRGCVNDMQIIYPTPLHFTNPEDHTRGAKQTYVLHIDPFLELRRETEDRCVC